MGPPTAVLDMTKLALLFSLITLFFVGGVVGAAGYGHVAISTYVSIGGTIAVACGRAGCR
jgi:hypothetical protein